MKRHLPAIDKTIEIEVMESHEKELFNYGAIVGNYRSENHKFRTDKDFGFQLDTLTGNK